MSNAARVNTVKKNHFHCPSQSLERIMSPYWVAIMTRSQHTMEQGLSCCLLMVGGTIMRTNVPILQRMQAWRGTNSCWRQTLLHVLAVFRFWSLRQSKWALCFLSSYLWWKSTSLRYLFISRTQCHPDLEIIFLLLWTSPSWSQCHPWIGS